MKLFGIESTTVGKLQDKLIQSGIRSSIIHDTFIVKTIPEYRTKLVLSMGALYLSEQTAHEIYVRAMDTLIVNKE